MRKTAWEKEQRRLDDTENKLHSPESTSARTEHCHGRNSRPDEGSDREVDGRSNTGDQHVGRQLSKHVSDSKNRNSSLVITILEVKILVEGVESGLGDVGAVEIVEHVENPKLGKHEHVELADNLLLELSGVGKAESCDIGQVWSYLWLFLTVGRCGFQRTSNVLGVLALVGLRLGV
ncbi:hypothetical protein HG531_006760 [Fusarium graminearum]|nr:hypothetical protein HG531_006760 [Fusarium graminearum]